MEVRQQVIDRVEAFLKRHSMSERQFGLRSVGDNKFVSRLRDPSVGVTLTNIERAERFMREFDGSHSETAAA